MKNKLTLVLLCCALTAANVYAKPNTVTLTGKLMNNSTKNINPPGWNYITARIILSDPNDTQYINIAGTTPPSYGMYFDLYYNSPVEYSIDTSHLSGSIYVEFYDPNTNYKCSWNFAKGSSSANPLTGHAPYCSQTDDDLAIQ